ncbi:MAG: ABC transporter permease [Alphaproteobacteria bacterium]|nr:ABC transporter permease [Alphaproteobacteria bacterium]
MALLAALAATTSPTPARAQEASVAVTAIVEHPSLDAVRDGIRDELAENGYVPGENLDFLFQTAQGNAATAVQIARRYVGEAPDVIVPISTPSAQAVVAATDTIPVVFSAVTDPLAAELVTDLDNPGGNVTGVSDLTPIEDHMALIREVLPDAQTLGMPYNPGEANAVAALEIVRDIAPRFGFEVIEAAAPNTGAVQSAAQSLVGRADAVYVSTDNTIVSAIEAVVSVGRENDLPIFTADTDSVRRGSIASIGFDYYDVGRRTGELVLQVLGGESPGNIPVAFAQGTNLVVNPAAAEAMGVTLPEAVIGRATEVVEE